jgi:hypothetical protein
MVPMFLLFVHDQFFTVWQHSTSGRRFGIVVSHEIVLIAWKVVARTINWSRERTTANQHVGKWFFLVFFGMSDHQNKKNREKSKNMYNSRTRADLKQYMRHSSRNIVSFTIIQLVISDAYWPQKITNMANYKNKKPRTCQIWKAIIIIISKFIANLSSKFHQYLLFTKWMGSGSRHSLSLPCPYSKGQMEIQRIQKYSLANTRTNVHIT